MKVSPFPERNLIVWISLAIDMDIEQSHSPVHLLAIDHEVVVVDTWGSLK